MRELEAFIVATFIGGGVVALALVLLVLLLRLAPTRIQERVRAGIIRWNEDSFRRMDRLVYASTVVLIVSMTIGLVAAVVYLFAI